MVGLDRAASPFPSTARRLNLVYETARDVQQICRDSGWRFCIIGGVAVQRWGEPRFTHDANVAVITGFGDEPSYVDRLLRSFSSRVPNAAEFALRSRVLLLKAPNGIPIDVSLGALDYEERMVARASDWNAAKDVSLRTCSAEDLVVLKVFAGRDIDWIDVRGIATRQAGRLDTALISRELDPLLELKEDRAARDRLDEILIREGLRIPDSG